MNFTMTDDTRPVLALLDLDGVLCDDRHRVDHALNRRWGQYFGLMHLDTPWPEGRVLVAGLLEQGAEMMYLTGRREDTRRETTTWLRDHGFPLRAVLMRRLPDRRPLAEVKAEKVAELLATGQWRAVVLYDDDPHVIRAVQERSGESAAVHCTWHTKPERMIRRDQTVNGWADVDR